MTADNAATQVELQVYGSPQPQGSKTAYVRGDRAVLTDGRRKGARESHAAWRQAVATAARDWLATNDGQVPWDDKTALCIAATFYLAKPKGRPKRQWWVRVRPDLDKLLRTVFDALADGGLLSNDSRVASVTTYKIYASDRQPGADLLVHALDEDLAAPHEDPT